MQSETLYFVVKLVPEQEPALERAVHRDGRLRRQTLSVPSRDHGPSASPQTTTIFSRTSLAFYTMIMHHMRELQFACAFVGRASLGSTNVPERERNNPCVQSDSGDCGARLKLQSLTSTDRWIVLITQDRESSSQARRTMHRCRALLLPLIFGFPSQTTLYFANANPVGFGDHGIASSLHVKRQRGGFGGGGFGGPGGGFGGGSFPGSGGFPGEGGGSGGGTTTTSSETTTPAQTKTKQETQPTTQPTTSNPTPTTPVVQPAPTTSADTNSATQETQANQATSPSSESRSITSGHAGSPAATSAADTDGGVSQSSSSPSSADNTASATTTHHNSTAIIVPVVIAVLLLAALGFWCIRTKRRRAAQRRKDWEGSRLPDMIESTRARSMFMRLSLFSNPSPRPETAQSRHTLYSPTGGSAREWNSPSRADYYGQGSYGYGAQGSSPQNLATSADAHSVLSEEVVVSASTPDYIPPSSPTTATYLVDSHQPIAEVQSPFADPAPSEPFQPHTSPTDPSSSRPGRAISMAPTVGGSQQETDLAYALYDYRDDASAAAPSHARYSSAMQSQISATVVGEGDSHSHNPRDSQVEPDNDNDNDNALNAFPMPPPSPIPLPRNHNHKHNRDSGTTMHSQFTASTAVEDAQASPAPVPVPVSPARRIGSTRGPLPMLPAVPPMYMRRPPKTVS
uniref:Uncharacterized protein n=1 Tax=Mycena chlorophos TaxID=658473 RepID=A0ABQ0LW11_MYCCL|nr:predicted protein [Mycena chlorophos]